MSAGEPNGPRPPGWPAWPTSTDTSCGPPPRNSPPPTACTALATRPAAPPPPAPLPRFNTATRHYRLNDEQDRPVDAFWRRHQRRGVRLHRGLTGMGAADITLTDVELAEVSATIQAFIDLTAADHHRPV